MKKIKPTRAAVLSMAVLVGFSVTEALMCAQGLLFDKAEWKAQQNGVKRKKD